MNKKKIVRITTIPASLKKLLAGQLHFMNQFYEVIAISSDESFLREMAEKDGIQYFSLPLTRKITFLKDLRAVYKLYKYLKKEQPFIVHTHTPKAGIVGMLAAKLANVPNRLHTVAGMPLLEATGVKRLILNKVESLTYACATKVYPNSNGLKQIIIDAKFTKPEKLRVIGNGSSNGISTDHFNPDFYSEKDNLALRKIYKIPEDDKILLFIGRLVGDKGINELIKAFIKIEKNYNDISLILVGEEEPNLDPLLLETQEFIRDHRKIYKVGRQKDVRPFLACADVLTFPTYREGFPNVVLEAGAMGVPAIVTNINGCNEIIIDDFNGIIIPVKNVLALVEAIKKILKKNDYRIKMQRVARKHIQDNYERRFMWNAILDEYRALQ